MLKRGIDIVIAGALLIACFPLLALCALLVTLESGGPILFRQLRMGRDFKPFLLLKLRTMRAGPGPVITLGFDPRITRLGSWLRRWKLDELPQLWNVFRGEMSLVGPRPVIPELAREFAADYRHLLQVRPGLTDPATIRYCHEENILSRVADPLHYFKTVVTPEKLRISRHYLDRATPLTDLGVIVTTAIALLSPPQPRRAQPPAAASHPQTSPHPLSPASMSQD